MSFLVFITATGLTVRFVIVFIEKLNPVHPELLPKGRHRHPEDIRRARNDAPEIITTGDILALVQADLKDGFYEKPLADGSMLNNEGWKTYPSAPQN
jgi:hypothetical protein